MTTELQLFILITSLITRLQPKRRRCGSVRRP